MLGGDRKMTRLLGTVLGVGVLCMYVAMSHAALIETGNAWPEPVAPSYEYTFAGFYDTASESIVSANLEVELFNLNDYAPVTHVFVDGVLVGSAPVNGDWANPDILPIEYGNLAPYLLDNELKITVQAEGGNLYFSKAVLDVETETMANPIPGTVWLFGLGLTGLLAIRRRFTQG